MGIQNIIREFMNQIYNKFPSTIVWVEKNKDEFEIYHDRKYSDSLNQRFFESIGELFYDMFIELGINNVIFIYKDPLIAQSDSNQISSFDSLDKKANVKRKIFTCNSNVESTNLISLKRDDKKYRDSYIQNSFIGTNYEVDENSTKVA